MKNDRLIIAIGRMERALSRIEASAEKRASGDADLPQRHSALREETSKAIAEINSLLSRAAG